MKRIIQILITLTIITSGALAQRNMVGNSGLDYGTGASTADFSFNGFSHLTNGLNPNGGSQPPQTSCYPLQKVYCYGASNHCLGLYNTGGTRGIQYSQFWSYIELQFDQNYPFVKLSGGLDVDADGGQNLLSAYFDDFIWQIDRGGSFGWQTVSEDGTEFPQINASTRIRSGKWIIKMRYAPKSIFLGPVSSQGGINPGIYGFSITPRFSIISAS